MSANSHSIRLPIRPPPADHPLSAGPSFRVLGFAFALGKSYLHPEAIYGSWNLRCLSQRTFRRANPQFIEYVAMADVVLLSFRAE